MRAFVVGEFGGIEKAVPGVLPDSVAGAVRAGPAARRQHFVKRSQKDAGAD